MESSGDRPLPGARYALGLLLAINLLNYADRQVLSAVIPKLRVDFPNVSLERIGSLATAFMVSYMLAAPIFGWLADRMSRWLLVGLSVIVWSLVTAATGLAWTFSILLLTRMCVGIGEAGYGPAAPTIISDLYPLKRRGAVLAWFYMAIPVGSALGYTIGGKIEAHFGWRAAFFACMPPGVLLGILCFLQKDPQRGAADAIAPPKPKRPHWRDYWHLLTIPSYILDTAGMAAMTFAIGGIAYWMPTYISEVRHAGSLDHVDSVFGIITVLTGITATLLGGLAGDFFHRFYSGSYFLISGLGILLACPFILLMLYVPFPGAWAMVGLAEFFLFFNTGPSNTILANVTHPSVRATAFAVNIFLIHTLGDGPSPPLLGHIVAQHGWNAAFTLVTAATALGGVLWMLGAHHLEKDTAAALHPPASA